MILSPSLQAQVFTIQIQHVSSIKITGRGLQSYLSMPGECFNSNEARSEQFLVSVSVRRIFQTDTILLVEDVLPERASMGMKPSATMY